jgi:hypothetical protein
MKKLYFLVSTVLVSVFFVNQGYAQYTAKNSGSWSSPITWAPGAIPSANCNNCTININAGVTVTLDRSVTLTGNSLMTIGAGGTAASTLKINNSGVTAGPITAASNVLIDAASTSQINLAHSNSVIDAGTAGTYDGVFLTFAGGIIMQKLIGNKPSLFLGGSPFLFFNLPPFYGTSVAGSHTIMPDGTLPVVLVDFNAGLVNNAVNVTWGTEIEINSDHFNVQRSNDGSHWQTIGTVAAHGFSSTHLNYSFTDQTPASGVNYYRLQSVDKDGKNSFSAVKIVRGTVVKGVSVFPNPATDYINVSLGNDASATLSIRLVNQFGQVMQQQKLSHAAGTIVSLQVKGYPEGLYYVQVAGDGGINQSSKVLITR